MSKRKVEWEWSVSRFEQFDANAVGGELEQIRKKRGAVHPTVVVENARRSKSPLHGMFEWQDSVAAQKYRERQARNIINHLRIVVVERGKEKIRMRGYVMVPGETKTGYVRADTITEQDRAEALIEEAIRGLIAWAERYSELSTRMPGVFAAIEQMVKRARRFKLVS